MFSEFYFYLIAFEADESKDYPIVYRIDRMSAIESTGRNFSFHIEIGLMTESSASGYNSCTPVNFKTITFKFAEQLEAALDRLPTKRVIDECDGVYTISAEVYGNGIDMWLRSQGDKISI